VRRVAAAETSVGTPHQLMAASAAGGRRGYGGHTTPPWSSNGGGGGGGGVSLMALPSAWRRLVAAGMQSWVSSLSATAARSYSLIDH